MKLFFTILSFLLLTSECFSQGSAFPSSEPDSSEAYHQRIIGVWEDLGKNGIIITITRDSIFFKGLLNNETSPGIYRVAKQSCGETNYKTDVSGYYLNYSIQENGAQASRCNAIKLLTDKTLLLVHINHVADVNSIIINGYKRKK